MKIWTVTFNDDSGVNTEVFTLERLAQRAFIEWVALTYCNMMDAEMPVGDELDAITFEKAEQRYQELLNTSGFMDSISFEEHEIAYAN